jgi:hypothetical protein
MTPAVEAKPSTVVPFRKMADAMIVAAWISE